MELHMQKKANNQQNFEEAFFTLAYSELENKLYNILPYLVGFELVNKNQDNTKALGVFAFRADNGQILYVPVFFNNGKIMGMELLYSKNNEQFYPLNEDFAEMFLKDDASGVGMAEGNRDTIQRNAVRGNFRAMASPPETGRVAYASAELSDEEIRKEAHDIFNSPKIGIWKDFDTDLCAFLKDTDDNVKQAMLGMIRDHEGYAEALNRFYDIKKVASSLVPSKPVKPEPVLTIYGKGKEAQSLEDNQKQKLAEQGYFILDKRASLNLSDFGEINIPQTISNATKSGIASYIGNDGELHYGLILTKPFSLHEGFGNDNTIVVNLEDDQNEAYIVSSNWVFVKDEPTIKNYAAINSKLPTATEVEASDPYAYPGKRYVLVNDELKVSEPFRVLSNYVDSRQIRHVEIETADFSDYDPYELEKRCTGYGNNKGTISGRGKRNNYEQPVKVRKLRLIFTKKKGDKVQFSGQYVYVPENFRFLELKPADKQQKIYRRPAAKSRLHSALADNRVFPITVRSNGSQFFASVKDYKKTFDNRLKAKVAMMIDLGLTESTVDEILKKAEAKKKVEGTIKMALTTPAVSDEVPYYNILGQPTYGGEPQVFTEQPSDGYMGDPTALGLGTRGEVEPVEKAVQQAIDLAANGQKQLFDTQSIGILSRYSSPAAKITEYTPSLVDALDKVGRLLFLMYWKTEEFEEMFGTGDLPEMMEIFRNVLKNLGDAIIYLKHRIPDLELQGAGGV